MLVRSYLQLCARSSAEERAQAVMVLARAYLTRQLAPEDHREAEAALTLALDDSSARVRRALAEVFCAAEDAPHHIVSALAADQSDVGALVLARSPLLTDDQLVDFAALGDMLSQIAIAMRAALSAPVAAAIAEIGSTEALIVLVRNVGADIPGFSLNRMVERLGADGEFREALLERPDLPVSVRQQLVDAVASSLGDFLRATGWVAIQRIDRLVDEAADSATLLIGSESDDQDLSELVAHLRAAGQLTPVLLLRSLLCGDRRLLIAALAELAAIPLSRVEGIVQERGPAALSALYRKAAMPAKLEPAFAAAITSIARYRPTLSALGEPRLQRRIIADVLAACTFRGSDDLARLISTLHRFHAEAVRDEARLMTTDILAGPEPITLPGLETIQDLALIAAPMNRPADASAFLPVEDFSEPVLEPTADILDMPAILFAEDIGAAMVERKSEIVVPVDIAIQRDGDGFPIDFNPDEYALRHAA